MMLMSLEMAYRELWSYWYLMCADNDGQTPACVCDPGDPCPAHRCWVVMCQAYRAIVIERQVRE